VFRLIKIHIFFTKLGMLVDVAGSTIQNENSGIFLPRTLLTGPKVIHIDQEIGKIDQYWDRFAR